MAVLTYNGNIIGKSSANDGILTIQKNGESITTFSANSSSNKTVNIEVPTTPSDIGALPISAGNSNPITGDLFLEKSSGSIGVILGSSTNTNNYGYIRFNRGDKYSYIQTPASLSDNHQLLLPDKGGTLAVTSDIPTSIDGMTSGTITGSSMQTITVKRNVGSGYGAGIAFETNAGYLGTLSIGTKPVFYNSTNTPYEMALKDDVVAKSGDTMTGALTVGDNLSVRPPLAINNTNSGGTFTWAAFQGAGTTRGFLGVEYGSRTYPIFCEAGQAIKEIALAENVVKLSNSATQTVTNTTGATVLGVKTGTNGAVYESFANSGGTLGYLGVNASNKPIYQSAAGGGDKEIALVDNVVKGSNHPTNAGISPYNSASVGGIQIDAVTPSSTTPSISFGFDIAYNRIVIYKDTGSGMSLWGLVPITLF